MTARLSATGVGATLGGRVVLHDIDLSLAAGEMLAVIGANGAGKTTLIRRLAGLVTGEGRIALDGMPVDRIRPRARARRIGYLPQGHQFHWPLPVADIVALGRLPYGGSATSLGEADRKAVAAALAATGTLDFADRAVTSLSGGERARVALARVLAGQPDIILADEPVASLDLRYQVEVLDLLRQRAKTGAAVLIVLHDLSLAARYADRLLLMQEGRAIALGTPAEVLRPERLQQAFGIATDVFTRDGQLLVVPASSAAPFGES